MPLLDQDLPARAQQGDENALAALIARMMPAIRKGAAECTAPGLDFDDAVQEGLIGLFHAVRGFDPAAGQTFTAYAAACIRHAQQDARRAALRLSESRASTFPCFHGGITMIKTKTQRYDTTVLDARALADALEIEEKAGWEVAEAGYDGTDFVVTFEREDAR